MKKIFVLSGCIAIAVIFTACSNPEDDAIELSTQFNEELQKYTECETPNDFQNLMYDAQSKIRIEYSDCENKYQDTPEDIQLFYDTYAQRTDSLIVEFNKAYAENIQKTLGTDYWYKPCIKDNFYVYTFNDSKLHIVGCKNEIPFTMNGDTIFFNDSEKSKVIIDFGYGIENFSLKDIETGDAVSFVKADDRSKICGVWSVNIDGWTYGFSLKNDGRYIISVLGRSQSGRWKFKNGSLTLDGGRPDKVAFKDVNTFTIPGGYFTRKGLSTPKSISFLFDEDNQVGDPSEPVKKSSASTSSSSGSEDWDEILDEYEEFVNDYVKLYKKAMAGDMSAMAEYASVLEDAQSLSNKLSNASSDLSSAQLKRYQKILSKMTSGIN